MKYSQLFNLMPEMIGRANILDLYWCYVLPVVPTQTEPTLIEAAGY